MKKLRWFAFAAVSAMSASTVSAGELADQCSAVLDAEGRDSAGCTCLEETVSASSALQEEFVALGAIADRDERWSQASDAAKEAMSSCFPDRG